MSFEITEAFVEQYGSNVFHLAQQRGSRLAKAVDVEMVVGRNAYFERLGATAAQQRTSRHADTPQIDTPHSRRRVSLVDYDWADLVDDLDKVRLLIDPTSSYVQAGAMAMGRTIDDVVIAAFNGDAFSGQSGGTTVALPAAQKIASASTTLTVAKLLEAKEKLDAAEIAPDAPRFFALQAGQVTDLLNLDKVTSADFNTVKALAAGEINSWLGFTFIRTERLPLVGAERANFAWAAPAMKLAMGKFPTPRISERDDKNYSVQVYFSMALGATRLEDEGVVQVLSTA